MAQMPTFVRRTARTTLDTPRRILRLLTTDPSARGRPNNDPADNGDGEEPTSGRVKVLLGSVAQEALGPVSARLSKIENQINQLARTRTAAASKKELQAATARLARLEEQAISSQQQLEQILDHVEQIRTTQAAEKAEQAG